MVSPDINPNNPGPENPQRGIEITLPNLDEFYEFIRDGVPKARIDQNGSIYLPLSRTLINDSIFDHEETDIVVHRECNSYTGYGSHAYDRMVFGFNTRFIPSNLAAKADYGYYSKESQELVIQRSKKLAPHLKWLYDGRVPLFPHSDNPRLDVCSYFGPTSKEQHMKDVLADWNLDNKEPLKGSLSEREYQRVLVEYSEKKRKFEASLNSLSSPGVSLSTCGYMGDLFQISNQESLTGILGIYSDFYKASLGAIYEEKGLSVPKLKIDFKIPEIPVEEPNKIILGVEQSEKSIEEGIKEVVKEPGYDWEGFESIAGQDEALVEAKKLVQAIKNPDALKRRGVKIPKGILFYGPPGTGKTSLAKAIAKEAGVRFVNVSVADIGNMYHGESEKILQKIFSDANTNGKTILFFDDFESMAPHRQGAYEVTVKTIAVFNENMDGIRSNSNVTVIAATNMPEGIDLAVKRSGRFDKIIQVGLPDEKGRVAIFKKHMEKAVKVSTEPENLFSPDLDYDRIGKESNGMSGADLANLVNRALETKLAQELDGVAWAPVGTEEILDMTSKIILERTEKVEVKFDKKQ